MSNKISKLKLFINGKWIESKTDNYSNCYNPSTGELTAMSPQCTKEEVGLAIKTAKEAFSKWASTPASQRVQVLFRMKTLVGEHLDELTEICARENGKCWDEAKGDVLKALEVIEFACGIPQLMKGDALMNCSSGYDTTQYKEPIGTFLGLCPWNFPAMIPHGWMLPICIATGNTFILKPAKDVPLTSIRFMELWEKAGLPNGVVNMVTCDRHVSEYMIKHPDIAGISFVGSTSVGQHIYTTAAQAGKRVQILGEAKNHALVLKDCNLDRTARGIINATYGCAGERCMALPAIVVEEDIADDLVVLLKKYAQELKVGPAYNKTSSLGPVISLQHKKAVTGWINKGVEEGAELILDGRKISIQGYENGFYMGPTIFDHVKPGMSIGDDEIFGPVTCVKRVKNFEEGIELMNSNQFANGSVIYTQNGFHAREFVRRTHGGMVGVNVGIPVPLSVFGFTGHKKSFIGDLHVMGTDGVRFYTQLKSVTTHWFNEKDADKKVDTWDGMLNE